MERTVGPVEASVTFPVRIGSVGQTGPTRRQARGPGWRRTGHGFYVPAHVTRTLEQRIAEASVVVPARGAITGWAALRWSGGRWFDGTTRGGRVELPVSIAAPGADLRQQPGIRVHKELMGPCDVITYDGLRLTTPARSTVFEMRHASSLVEAVVAADMAFFSDLASIAETSRCLDDHAGLTGNPQARRALALAHENSWSPMETRLRLLWLLGAGLPPVLSNAPVFDLDGRHLGTPDLLDVEAGLAIQYDGQDYHRGMRRLSDNEREDALRDGGLSYLTVLKGEFRHRFQLVGRLRRARAKALVRQGPRRWTTEPPPGWEPRDTVEERRAGRRRNGPSNCGRTAVPSTC